MAQGFRGEDSPELWHRNGYSERDEEPGHDLKLAHRLSQLYGQLLTEVGEDPGREGLAKTPMRAARAMEFLTQGYRQNLDEVVNEAIFTEDTDDMVIVRDVEFYSLCEHHLLPFYGKVHVAYIPNGRIIGLSKIPRIVDMYARRFQVQERFTSQVARALAGAIQPQGVGVVSEAAHMCMMIRGVEKQHSSTVTSCVLGSFRRNATTRKEFFDLLKVNRFEM
ncbi:GTP cyclohydrolase I FolE [Candidatus Poribacteria bacterium]|nr:GTP cyclohydrolase I FolE [Candidatus Poribacteria bacterium]